MKHDEPHRIEDNEPAGQQAIDSQCTNNKKKHKVIVAVGFDDNLKEFELWDYLYDVETEIFELEAIPDYKNRIQYYKISADKSALHGLRLWLMRNKFKYKIDKK